MIVPTLCVGMYLVRCCGDAERPRRHSQAERGNDRASAVLSVEARSWAEAVCARLG